MELDQWRSEAGEARQGGAAQPLKNLDPNIQIAPLRPPHTGEVPAVDGPLRARASAPMHTVDANRASAAVGLQHPPADVEPRSARAGGFILNPGERQLLPEGLDLMPDEPRRKVGLASPMRLKPGADSVPSQRTAGWEGRGAGHREKENIARGWQLPALSDIVRSAPLGPRSPLQPLQLSNRPPAGVHAREPAPPERKQPPSPQGGAFSEIPSRESATQMRIPTADGRAQVAQAPAAAFRAAGLSSPMSPGSPSPERATGMRSQQMALTELGRRSRLRPAPSMDRGGGGGGGGWYLGQLPEEGAAMQAVHLAEDRASAAAASAAIGGGSGITAVAAGDCASPGAALPATPVDTPERAGGGGSPRQASSTETAHGNTAPVESQDPAEEYTRDGARLNGHLNGHIDGGADEGEAPSSPLGVMQSRQQQAAPSLLELASMHTSELHF